MRDLSELSNEQIINESIALGQHIGTVKDPIGVTRMSEYADEILRLRAAVATLREAAAAVINTLPSMILCDHRDCTEPATFVTSDKHLCGAHNDGGDVLLTDFAISLRVLQAVLVPGGKRDE